MQEYGTTVHLRRPPAKLIRQVLARSLPTGWRRGTLILQHDGPMRYSLARGLFWLAVFALLALLPLGLARLGAVPPARSFWIEFGVALGFLALSLFALQFIFSGRFKWVAPSFGMDNIIQYHREVGLIAFLLVLMHPIILIAADSTFVEYFDPRANLLRAVFLISATLAATAIILTSVWRTAFRLEYEWWRLLHGGLALSIIFIGLVHAIQVQHYLGPLWKKAVLALLIGIPMYALFHTRVVRPWLSRRRPWRITDVKQERARVWSLTMEPTGHDGMRFKPGQFAWITINESPFTLQQHPFSFASSARSPRLTFTAKEFGDFTGSWKDIRPGTTAFVEGPFGSFIPDPSPETGLFLVMGGIGITPAMGILRTLRDDSDPRPLVLIYGTETWEKITFREELEALRREIDLEVVHLLENPPTDWDGESGFVTRDLLQKYLPAQPNTFQYFVCGPKPLMDITEQSLRELGVAWQRIYAERFEIV
jgi:predicted ferric reductase